MRSLVLIVEDEVDAADVLALMFEHWGYDTVIGNDGFEGYHLAISMLPDLVLADYAMPGLNGAELAKKACREHGHRINSVHIDERQVRIHQRAGRSFCGTQKAI